MCLISTIGHSPAVGQVTLPRNTSWEGSWVSKSRVEVSLLKGVENWDQVAQPSFLAPVLSSEGVELDPCSKLSAATPATPRAAAEDKVGGKADLRSSAFLLQTSGAAS